MKYIIITIEYLSIIAAIYAAMAFISLESNPLQWHLVVRLIFTALVISVTTSFIALAGEIDK